MKNVIRMSLATAIMMSVGTVSAQAADEISIVDNVKVKGQIRPRYEFVEHSEATVGTKGKNDANALTNRLVIGVNADLFGTDWLSGYAEMTDVHALNNNYYDGGLNGTNTDYNTVADAEQTRVTQSYLDLKYKKTKLRYGRQMINLDNQRFIGAVGWRQMPQTYNATSIFDNSFDGLNLMASYVTQYNTIFEDGAVIVKPRTNSAPTESVFLNAKYKVMDGLTATAYGYLLEDFGDTYGIALTGKPKIADNLTVNYRAEYAMLGDSSFESDYELEAKNDADYYNLELGVNFSGILAGIGYEFQSGKSATDTSLDNKTFSTPLGTNHGHNGWADQFLVTPTQGLIDMDIMVGYKSKKFGVAKAIYHDFSADQANAAGQTVNYGTELDLLYKRSVPGVKGLTGMLKAAFYEGGDSKIATGNTKDDDYSKFWVMLDYKFSN